MVRRKVEPVVDESELWGREIEESYGRRLREGVQAFRLLLEKSNDVANELIEYAILACCDSDELREIECKIEHLAKTEPKLNPKQLAGQVEGLWIEGSSEDLLLILATRISRQVKKYGARATSFPSPHLHPLAAYFPGVQMVGISWDMVFHPCRSFHSYVRDGVVVCPSDCRMLMKSMWAASRQKDSRE